MLVVAAIFLIALWWELRKLSKMFEENSKPKVTEHIVYLAPLKMYKSRDV
ncbi:hypothetical protein LCGC14_0264620 [marine sediment metagenome]|uniref:Uncharacterized protein n=1 Tax=marine sediment metagenome TaxID=412755 RepID=A0A0F9U5M0_9ZZZZ